MARQRRPRRGIQRPTVDGRVLTDIAEIRRARRERSVKYTVSARPSISTLLAHPEIFGEGPEIRQKLEQIKERAPEFHQVDIHAFFDAKGQNVEHIHLLPAPKGTKVYETPRYVFFREEKADGKDVLVFVKEGDRGWMMTAEGRREPLRVESIFIQGTKEEFETGLRRLLGEKRLIRKRSLRRS